MTRVGFVLLLAVTAVSGQDKPCQTPIDEYQPSVESILKLPEGTSVSWLDKHVSRLGDDAAVVLIRLGAPENLRDESDTRKALQVLQLAFNCPSCIERSESRTAGVTMLLLDTMDGRNQNTQLKEQIAQTRGYIRNQLKEYWSVAKLLNETPIAVKGTSTQGKVVLVDSEMNGESLQLECFVSQAHCRVPKPGKYLAVRMPWHGIYMDCLNIDLYEQSSDSQTAKLIGEYCIAGDAF